MKWAYLLLREGPHYRRQAFRNGLERHGYSVNFEAPTKPKPDDVLVIWNRYAHFHKTACRFEAVGARVLVTENAYLGNEFCGDRWYAIARNHHNGAGWWPDGGPERWDRLNVELKPWRTVGHEVVVLPQRGIGPEGIAMPRGWKAKGRVRRHPGTGPCVPLERDLAQASAVVTWGSGAALKALLYGIPVYHDFPKWIGAAASARYREPLPAPFLGDRLPMFRRLAWAQWRLSEIEDGTAMAALL